MADGLFGPGIFGTGIDLSALDEDTAWKLGVFFGEQLAAAEERGRRRAIAALREHDAKEAERFAEVTRKYPGNWDGWPYAHPFGRAAHYLESLAPKEPTDD